MRAYRGAASHNAALWEAATQSAISQREGLKAKEADLRQQKDVFRCVRAAYGRERDGSGSSAGYAMRAALSRTKGVVGIRRRYPLKALSAGMRGVRIDAAPAPELLEGSVGSVCERGASRLTTSVLSG